MLDILKKIAVKVCDGLTRGKDIEELDDKRKAQVKEAYYVSDIYRERFTLLLEAFCKECLRGNLRDREVSPRLIIQEFSFFPKVLIKRVVPGDLISRSARIEAVTFNALAYREAGSTCYLGAGVTLSLVSWDPPGADSELFFVLGYYVSDLRSAEPMGDTVVAVTPVSEVTHEKVLEQIEAALYAIHQRM
jgi:hypothetical protein